MRLFLAIELSDEMKNGLSYKDIRKKIGKSFGDEIAVTLAPR